MILSHCFFVISISLFSIFIKLNNKNPNKNNNPYPKVTPQVAGCDSGLITLSIMSINSNFGFFAHATNGLQFGDVDLASTKSNLKYNYKFNSDHDSSKFFDETIGYLSAEFDYIKFKIGRDRVNIGYGFSKVIMDSYFPQMDYLSI